MRKVFFCIFTVLFFMIWLFPAAASEMSLEAFLLSVRENNQGLQASLKRLEASYHTVRAAVATQRPGVGLRGSASYNTDGSLRRQGAYSLSAAVSHRFDVSGVYSAQERQLLLQYNTLASEHLALINNTVASAESLYWSSFIARENSALQKEILAQRREDLRITEEKFRQQLIPRLDVVRAQARVEEAESIVVQAESVYRDTLTQLATLAGGIPVVPRAEILLVPSLSVKAGVEAALSTRNDVRAAELTLERAGVLRTLAAKGMSPTVEGSIGYTVLTDSLSQQPDQNEFLFSLSVSVPVYDGGRTKADTEEKARSIEAAERTLEARRLSVREDVLKARTQWEKAAALEASKRKQVARSDEELKITQLMYMEGMGAQIDLLNAQVDNQRVRTEHLDAIKEMYLALVSLRRAMSEYEPAPVR
jgi:outer membrane protein TolC